MSIYWSNFDLKEKKEHNFCYYTKCVCNRVIEIRKPRVYIKYSTNVYVF